MRKWLILALLPGAFFAAQLNAQTLRIDVNASTGLSFDNEIQNRVVTEDILNPLIQGFTGDWNMNDSIGLGPIALTYFHPLGGGRLAVGLSHERYSYSGDFTSVLKFGVINGIGMGTIDSYKYSQTDIFAGYEIKADKLLITPKIGRRSYSKEYASTRTDLFMGAGGMSIFGSKGSSAEGSASGLYLGVGAEFALADGISLIAEYATTMSPLTGSADLADSYSLIMAGAGVAVTNLRFGSSSNDMEVDYTGYKLGMQFGADTLKFKVGIMQDSYSISYPGRMDFGMSINAGALGSSTAITHPFTDSDATETWLVRQAVWGGKGTDKRMGIFYGVTKDINF